LRVFDTTFIIDLVNSDPRAVKIAQRTDQEGSVASLSVISVHKHLLGVCVKYSGKEILKVKLEAAERDLAPFMILPLTYDIVSESAKIQASLIKRGRFIGINDIYIAATVTAVANKSPIVTRNRLHFENIQGLTVEPY
jgi:predicted nucleic acid-binding protein